MAGAGGHHGDPPMQLYNLTLEKGGGVTCMCQGSFTAEKQTEIVLGRGEWLELLSVVDKCSGVRTVSTTNVFGSVRKLEAFRFAGQQQDYLALTSDSGRIVILEYDARAATWKKLHQETFGKTGIRRAVPGAYLASDPKGRALMVGAVEKEKFVYCLQRDEGNVMVSSPLVAHKSNVLTYDLAGLNVGLENPVFAAIEVDHSELDEDPRAPEPNKHLVLYEFELGLNHVVRRSPWQDDPLPQTAHKLFPVPAGTARGQAIGPGGVLVCAENMLLYYKEHHLTLREPLLRRTDMGHPSNGLLVVSGGLIKTHSGHMWLLQSECGDLYKVTLSLTPDRENVQQINVSYFDTIPVSRGLLVLRIGGIFAAAEFGNHMLYRVTSLGGDGDEDVLCAMKVRMPDGGEVAYPLFNPRSHKHIVAEAELPSLSPLLDLKVGQSAEVEGKQLFAFCGRGGRSSVRVLQHGLALEELGRLPFLGTPLRVWALRKRVEHQYHDYYVVSFSNATRVFEGGDTVEECRTALMEDAPTLTCQTMADGSLLQITATCIHHVRRDGQNRDLHMLNAKPIVCAEANERQVAVALQGGELEYYELDVYGELVKVASKELPREVRCLSLAPVAPGAMRGRFLAVGTADRVVLLLSVDSGDEIATVSRQACSSDAADIKLVDMEAADGAAAAGETALCLYIGCQNGILIRSVLDRVTGDITDARTRFCGTLPCRLVVVRVEDTNAVLILSSRCWLGYYRQRTYHLTPLTIPALTHAAAVSSVSCDEGLLALAGNDLVVYAFGALGGTFSERSVDLRATPRCSVKHPVHPVIVVVEADHRAYSDSERKALQETMKAQLTSQLPEDKAALAAQAEELPEKEYGATRAPLGKWCSYLRVMDSQTLETYDSIELDDNLAALSASTVVFQNTGGEVHLVVGAAAQYVPNPKSHGSGVLLTFRFARKSRSLELLHRTVVDGLPKCLHPFQGRLLVGVGNKLHLYDLGRVKLLKKSENRQIPNMVTSIATSGGRIFVGDITDSVSVLKYHKEDNRLAVFADDTLPRWVTCLAVLDHNTVAVGDKLGNVSVLRLDEYASEELDNAKSQQSKWLSDRGFLNGAPQRFEQVASFYVGSWITSIQKASLTTGGVEVVVYTTLSGAIGCLVPVTKREDARRLELLEMHMRQEAPPLSGRDHLAFRSYYLPQRSVVDGDLLEAFATLNYDTQCAVAGELQQTPPELLKRLEELRNKVL